jgi:hypothetical protein
MSIIRSKPVMKARRLLEALPVRRTDTDIEGRPSNPNSKAPGNGSRSGAAALGIHSGHRIIYNMMQHALEQPKTTTHQWAAYRSEVALLI